jgi:hypothetical protein
MRVLESELSVLRGEYVYVYVYGQGHVYEGGALHQP